MAEAPTGWQPDPFGAHQLRYVSLGGTPTRLVSDGGVRSYDDPPSARSPTVTWPGSARRPTADWAGPLVHQPAAPHHRLSGGPTTTDAAPASTPRRAAPSHCPGCGRLADRNGEPCPRCTAATAAPEGPPVPHRRWRTWTVRVLAAAVFATAFGALLLNEIHASSQFVGTRSSLTATQRQNDAVLADLAAVRQRLQAVDGQATRDTKALATDTAQLEAVQAALGHAQDNVTLQGSAISTLQSCLSGVEQALNALSVGDQSSAIAALRAVSADCQMAAAANG